MKKIVSLVITGVAVFALSGCGGDDAGYECNTKLVYIDSVSGSGSASSINLKNFSDYTVERVYSGIYGDTLVSSINIPTVPGGEFTVNSSFCGDDEILKIVDDEGCMQEVNFLRVCNETARFEVVNNF